MLRANNSFGAEKMPRGRRPRPDALKALQGNPGKRPLFLEDRVAPVTSAPPALTTFPDFLKHDRERELFKRVIEDYLHRRIARAADTNAYARWAVYMHRWMIAKESLDGIAHPSYQSPPGRGRWMRLPSFGDLLDLERAITALEDRLGLNPTSRQTIVRGLSTLPVDIGGLEERKAKDKQKKTDANTIDVEPEPPSPIGFGKLN
jgi:hypothetical protein